MFNLDSRFSSLYILTETIFKGYFYDSPHTLYTLQVHKTKGYSSNKLKKKLWYFKHSSSSNLQMQCGCKSGRENKNTKKNVS
jgi:hypothetical protein